MEHKQRLAKVLNRREVLKYGLYGGLATSLSGGFWLSGCEKWRRWRRPNVILLSVDTLRPDHLGCYGYNRDTSINVDKFAAESVLFENCFSHASSTAQACSSFLSGFLPHETTVLTNATPLPLQVPTIADILKEAEYKTYAVVSNYVLRKKLNFGQGFDIYDDQMDQSELVRKSPERIAEYTTATAVNILKQHESGNFFMWIHYQDPHGPYTPQKPYDSLFLKHGREPFHLKFNDSTTGRDGIPSYQRLGDNTDYHYYVAQYDGEIAYFDEHFKRLITSLKELDVYDDTMIIFTADHGEAMGEYNYFFAHGHSLNNCQIRVPLIIKYRKSSPGKRQDFVQHMDIVPTILKAVGIKPVIAYRGRNLLLQYSEPAVICSELSLGSTSVIVDGLKLVVYGQRAMLFEISKDPYEKRNLVNDLAYRGRLETLANHLNRLRREDFLAIEAAKEKPKLTDEEREKLRSLGYVE